MSSDQDTPLPALPQEKRCDNPPRRRCLTIGLYAHSISQASEDYLKAFGHPPPALIEGHLGIAPFNYAALVAQAVKSGQPLQASVMGEELKALQGAYLTRFGAKAHTPPLMSNDSKEEIRQQIDWLNASLTRGKRRLMLEFGDGSNFPPAVLPDGLNTEGLEEIWLDASGRPEI